MGAWLLQLVDLELHINLLVQVLLHLDLALCF
jgi:hypothetical protein